MNKPPDHAISEARRTAAQTAAPEDYDLDRRHFLEWMGAALALASASGCSVSPPKEEIVPQVRSPEYTIPGKPQFYATAATLGGYATGVLVESHQGRPTRIEGNPDHPASHGAIDALSQATILSLYDPDRSQAITSEGTIRTWDDLHRAMDSVLREQVDQDGAGIRLLTETATSPTLTDQIARLLERYPQARWHQYDSINQDQLYAGADLVFGRPWETRCRLDRADVIVSFEADFLTFGPGHVRYARDFMSRRRYPLPTNPDAESLNRLYVAESNVTCTGAVADHRLALRPSEFATAISLLAQAVGLEIDMPDVSGLSDEARRWLDVAAADLQSARGVVLIGPWHPPELHALVHHINQAIGSVGQALEYTEPVPTRPGGQLDSLRELVAAAQQGEVELLLIAHGNPVYDVPADIPFAEALQNVGLSVRLGLYEDETSRRCDWHIPAAHELESWSDARAFDGTATIVQPLIEPLYGGKTIHDLISVLLGEADRTSYETVRGYWESNFGQEGFRDFWRQALHDGVVPDSRYEPLSPEGLSEIEEPRAPSDGPNRTQGEPSSGAIELSFRPDPTLYDGRFARNAWLQELPKPITKLTWDNAALIGPATARELGVRNEQIVSFERHDRTLRLPVWIVPGHAEGAATVYLGHGRELTGDEDRQVTANASAIRTSDAFWSAGDVAAKATNDRYRLASTQQHHRMEGRDLARTLTWQAFQEQLTHDHDSSHDAHSTDLSLYPPVVAEGDYAWGMSINLDRCTGCNACVIACQAENNIPTVGKQEVLRGREMHWIRIDQYFLAEAEGGTQFRQQPVTCMHCENAPCEVVCPVAATVHSSEGLNEMVYNRCVGTRYCSNNCPYKVRRFNFFKYAADDLPVLELLHNPDVTVRSRGVMEKCTYCVQRISAARIDAKKEQRSIRDGEVVTACQSVCPTQAIVFGDTADPNSAVSQVKQNELDYGLLTELNTRPRTTYLARITNPNPELT